VPCSYLHSGIQIFLTSKGNETWFEKIGLFEKSGVKLQRLTEETEISRNRDSAVCLFFCSWQLKEGRRSIISNPALAYLEA